VRAHCAASCCTDGEAPACVVRDDRTSGTACTALDEKSIMPGNPLPYMKTAKSKSVRCVRENSTIQRGALWNRKTTKSKGVLDSKKKIRRRVISRIFGGGDCSVHEEAGRERTALS